MARRMAAVAALLRHRDTALGQSRSQGFGLIGGFEQTTAEVSAAMNLSPMAAGFVVTDAAALDTRLPRVAALLAEGRTDWRTVRLIISRTDLISDEKLIAKVDQSLAARIGNWHGWSRQRIINAVDAAVRTTDPDAARERRLEAEDKRHVGITAQNNGMAELYGIVGAPAATAFDRRLSELAKQVCAEDPRTMDQRRADALAALTQGHRLACTCGRSGRREGGDKRGGQRPDRDRQWFRARLSGGLRRHRCRAGPRPRRRGGIDASCLSGDQSGAVIELPAIGSSGARRALPRSHLPLPGMQPTGRCVRFGPHSSVQPRRSGVRWIDGVREPEMPLPATSSAQNFPYRVA